MKASLDAAGGKLGLHPIALSGVKASLHYLYATHAAMWWGPGMASRWLVDPQSSSGVPVEALKALSSRVEVEDVVGLLICSGSL